MSAYNRAHQLRIDSQSEPQVLEGGTWGDMAMIEAELKDSEFFTDECAEIMADFLTSWRDQYAEEKFMRLMRVLADRCEAHINALDGGA
jgi:hypothetical protein